MHWTLLLIFYWPSSHLASGRQEPVVMTETQEACEAARTQLLRIPGYEADYLICIPGVAPKGGK